MFRTCLQECKNAVAFKRLHASACSPPQGTESRVFQSEKGVYQQRLISRRPLDGLESMFHEYHKTGIAFSFLLTPLKSKVPIREESLLRALEMVSYRQPLLRARVTESLSYPTKYFETTERRTNFGFSVLDQDISNIEAITEDIFASTKFDSDNGPIWKTVLIPGKFDPSSKLYTSGLALAISHAVANGPSLPVILRQIIGSMETISHGTAPKLQDIPSFPLFPSSADLLSLNLREFEPTKSSPSSADFINPVLSEFPTTENLPKISEPKTKVLIRTISADEATWLLQQCRNNSCTITGAILAACHFSFCSLLRKTSFPADATNDITCLTAVDRNHRPSLPFDYSACHYGSLTYNIPLTIQNTNFWELAKSFSQGIKRDKRNDKDLEFLLRLEADRKGYMDHILSQGSLKLASRQSSSLILSNTGQYIFQNNPESSFRPQALFVGTPIHKRFGTFGNYLMSLNGATHYMFCYDGSIISPEVAQRYSDGVWDALQLQTRPALQALH